MEPKKLANVLFAFLLILQSCAKDGEIHNDAKCAVPDRSTQISIEQATSNLLKFMDEFDSETRSGKPRKIAEAIPLGLFEGTRSSESSANRPSIYLFNFTNDEGYALVSGDTRAPDILAFAEKGHLDPAEGIDNPGLAIFLANAETYVRLKTGLPIYDDTGNPIVLNDDGDDGYDPDIDEDYVEYSDWKTSSEDIEQRLACYWGQRDPLNRYCYTDTGEKALVGCVAVAIAQIMYHYGHNHTYNGTAYDWNVIRNYWSHTAIIQQRRWTWQPNSSQIWVDRKI